MKKKITPFPKIQTINDYWHIPKVGMLTHEQYEAMKAKVILYEFKQAVHRDVQRMHDELMGVNIDPESDILK